MLDTWPEIVQTDNEVVTCETMSQVDFNNVALVLRMLLTGKWRYVSNFALIK